MMIKNSNVIEVIRPISSFFLWRNSTHKESIKSTQPTFCSNISMPKKQTSIFHSDISMCLKSIKATQATFCSDISMHLENIKSKQATFRSDIFMRVKKSKRIGGFFSFKCF